MIKVEQISKSFKGNSPVDSAIATSVLNGVSFEIARGDFVAVMDPSGSGKSTLLYSVSGMDRVTEGQVWFDGVSLSEMNEQSLSGFRLNKMGFVFQNAQMLKNLSIFDNLILPGLVAKKEKPQVIRKRAKDLMKRMDIDGLCGRDIREVSGGQLQRASICRAMINNPEVLFLDEPTGALNSEATDQVLDILEDLNGEGMTIMTVTHDLRVALRAKRVIYLRDGAIAGEKELTAGGNREQALDDWLKGV
ncbi:ABC transporter ATP-binding protein [uncultured Acetobacterium sp.]|uniref:ABC transporter ATP-binding protein n=1 Tax=uncultured Acetobacterium sp. TaxID=217139 RepID=UPI0025DC94F5|nr:ABC transporter ATP-binding protein [uncultured Acetobacterium sp.]